mgnify:CR=1 FL=1
MTDKKSKDLLQMGYDPERNAEQNLKRSCRRTATGPPAGGRGWWMYGLDALGTVDTLLDGLTPRQGTSVVTRFSNSKMRVCAMT